MLAVYKSKRSRYILFITIGILLLLITGATVWYYTKPVITTASETAEKSDKHAPPAPGSFKVVPTDKNPSADQTGVPNIKTSDDTPTSAAFPTTQPNLQVAITSTRQSGSKLYVKSQIIPAATGTCRTELTRDNQPPITSESQIDGEHCETPFDTSSMAKGSWTLTLKAFVANNVATASKSITIQ